MEFCRLVASVRAASGLSVRRLAQEADVAGSTITRIQSGAIDPTVQTLARIFNAAGFDLTIGAVRSGTSHGSQLASVADAWSLHRGRLRLEWVRWRGLLDQLTQNPKLIPEAIYLAPPPSGHPVVDALLAAVAEKLADDVGSPRPAWTFTTPVLDEPYRPPVARQIEGRPIPRQLLARGLMIDTESLWRASETSIA